jgi:DamX protein
MYEIPPEAPTLDLPMATLREETEPLFEQDAPELFHPEERMPEPAPLVPAHVPPPPIEMPEQWGFDEAQIETARRATAPAHVEPAPPPMREVVREASRPNRWIAMLIFAVVVVGLGFAGLAAWNWWEAKQAAATPQVVVQRPKRKKVVPPVATATSTQASMLVVKPAQPAPQPVPPAPATPQPAPVTTTVAAKPVVVKPAPQPAPQPVASAEPTRAHYDDMARTFAAQATGNYTVQFELVCETASVTKAIQAGGNGVWFVPTSYRGRGCYRVFYGKFATRDEAQRAIASIPASLREGSSPSVVSVPKQ